MAQQALMARKDSASAQDTPTLRLRNLPLPGPHGPGDAAGEPLEAAARAFHDLQEARLPPAQAVDYWRHSFPGPRDHAHLFCELHQYAPHAAERLAQAMIQMPSAGADILDFHLLAELGRGAFGRVFLARQQHLANRHVVVKVAADVWGEAQSLAQLRHPNIVPVYSVHQSGPFQVVCMPFHGSTTFRDLLQKVQSQSTLPTSGRALSHTLAGLSYIKAVVSLGTGLAHGLAHAHDHGIIHRDLKPANVLLTEDGQPMLLDFNVAEDTKRRTGAVVAWVAGTMPYMAPEQLAGLRTLPVTVDERCDIYAFGILLFELLTGRYPFTYRGGSLEWMLEHVIADRRAAPPPLRRLNPGVTPALEAIVRRCLEPDPDRRYASAHLLHEDLDCQRRHRTLRHTPEPSRMERLRKWSRRHPRALPAAVGGLVAMVLLAGALVLLMLRDMQLDRVQNEELTRNRQQQDRERATASWQRFQDELKTAQFLLYTRIIDPAELANGIALGTRLLDRYGVIENPAWRQDALVRGLPADKQVQLALAVGELALLVSRAVLLQQEGTAPRDGALNRVLLLNERAADCSIQAAGSPALWRQRADVYGRLGKADSAATARARADSLPLRTAQDHYWLAGEHVSAGRLRAALPLLQKAGYLDPQNFWAWFVLANCYERLTQDARAESCYGACIALAPSFHWTYFNRGLALLRQRDYRLASADFDKVIELRPALTQAYVNRALARQGLGQYAQAESDLTEALRRGDSSTRLFFLRARVRGKAGDKEGARRDYQEGLRRTPVDEQSWLARGFAHLSRDPKAALADFEAALRINPRSPAGLQNKAHVLAEKMDRTGEALQVLDRALELYPDSVEARAGRGVLLARLGRRDLALRDAEEALRRDARPPRLYQAASTYALTARQQPDDRLRALHLLSAALRQGYGFDLLEHDSDLDAIRQVPEFRRLTESARALTMRRQPPLPNIKKGNP